MSNSRHTKRVRFSGPPGLACPELAIATGGSAELEPGDVFEVPAELAESLVESSPWFKILIKASRPRKERKTPARKTNEKPETPATEEASDA